MKLRYFLVDRLGQLRKVTRARIDDLWHGRSGADALGAPAGSELRLISVLCDADLQPRHIYFLRLPLVQGRFTEESYLTLQAFARPDCVTPQESLDYHLDGWPRDFLRQLAVALDVPVAALDVPFDVGGPLLLAAALRVSPALAVRYLR